MTIAITTSADPQVLRWASSEHVVITVTMATNGSITSSTYLFTVATKSGTRIFQKTMASGIAITDAGGTTWPGIVTVTLTANDTILATQDDMLEWDLWKSNAGAETKLAHGDVEVGKQLYR